MGRQRSLIPSGATRSSLKGRRAKARSIGATRRDRGCPRDASEERAIAEGEYSFPVGRVQFFHLGPLTFSEFLMALREERLVEMVEKGHYLEALHARFIELLKLYYFIGGMPRAVRTYVETKSLIAVREDQRSIVQTYKADFPKYAKRA